MESSNTTSRPSESELYLFIKLLNCVCCIMYAAIEHNTAIYHPFAYALETAFRMIIYTCAGQIVANFVPFIGDICVIGSLSCVMCKILLF